MNQYNFCQININGIITKYHEFCNILNNYNIHIILLQDWYHLTNQKAYDRFPHIPNYNCYHDNNGSTAIIVRDDIISKKIDIDYNQVFNNNNNNQTNQESITI